MPTPSSQQLHTAGATTLAPATSIVSEPNQPIQRVLVANRGEIALRIVRTLRRLGVESVLAVSTADRESLGARLADRTICIGPGPATDSYLQINALIHAALGTGAQAIHPGYGFLSERAEFAQACENNGITFIGPSAEHIRRVGDKLEARQIADAAGVPVTPGGPVTTLHEALVMADHIGYPVLIKAVGGGGGRGLKRADTPAQLRQLFELASAEALSAFGDGRVYIECFVSQGRHVEVQILGDGERVIHLGDRDCSVQRRYQKLIEEAPAPCLPDDLRASLREAAVRFARHIGYRNAGTVEFLVDIARGQFYFLEMNARIQVEHPVTEMITGIDLVEQQLHIAQGNALSLSQDEVQIQGHAIECRINAEDPHRDFAPSPGRVTEASFPTGDGIRVDTHIETGAFVPPFYDSMVAKIIALGNSRKQAIERLAQALRQTRLSGIKTNIPVHLKVLETSEFIEGGVDTGFLGRHLATESPENVKQA